MFDMHARFQPVKTDSTIGVLVLVDHSVGQPVEYVEKQSMLDEASSDAAPAAGSNGRGSTAATAAAPVNTLQAEPDAPDDMDLDD
jgi:hypothetical protein